MSIASVPSVLERILSHKRIEIERQQRKAPQHLLERQIDRAMPVRDFAAALRSGPNISLIAEIKKASPSRGVLLENFDHLRLAETYIHHGAAALSVLTDTQFFQGSLKFIEGIRQSQAIGRFLDTVPLLRKDFIIDPYQVYEARFYGADALLLIVAALEDEVLVDLLRLTRELGMEALVEVHTAEELQRALLVGASIIGVNNRDLHSFETHLEVTEALATDLKGHAQRPLLVSESGIFTPNDIERLRSFGVDAVLVGEAIVTAPDIATQVQALSGVSRRAS